MTNIEYEQFLLEKKLANKLMHSNIEERRKGYKSLYGELFDKFPQIANNENINISDKIGWQMKFLKPFLEGNFIFMEIGAGNCLLSIEVSKHVKQVISYEVADAIPSLNNKPNNLIIKIFNGIDFVEPKNSIDILYSNQVFEHLHPEDAVYHIKQYFSILKKGGKVIIITPHSLTGPYDISRNYSTKPEGLHLKEYNFKELREILNEAGFTKIKIYLGHRKVGYFSCHLPFFIALEKIYNTVPLSIRYKLKNFPLVNIIFRIKIVAEKN